MKKIAALVGTVAMLAASLFAAEVTIPGYGTYTVPDDFAAIVNDNMSAIVNALEENNVSQADLDGYVNQVTDAYDDIVSSSGISNPYTSARNGLNDFSDALNNSFPNTQIQQNVWANSWIGYLVQVGNGGFCPRFGLGVNTGVASLDMTAMKETGDAFKMDLGSMPDTLVMPTITFDARVGGVKIGDLSLPFDFGFTLSSIDSSKLGLDDLLKDVAFDYFCIGFDVRYCIWEPKVLDTKLSVGAGYYFTKGSVAVNSDDANAGLDFKSSNFTLNAQISTKLLFFRPFAGARLMFTNSSVDWYAKNLDWTNILDSQGVADAVTYGLLPSSFSGGADGFKFRPVIQGGFAFDLAVIDLTFSASYDLSSKIAGGAFSLRFSL